MVWILQCTKCGNVRKLYVSYNIKDFEKIYVYCQKCRTNTFHEVKGWEE